MEQQLTAASPAVAKILEERSDGSGIVEIPVARVAAEIDFGITAGGGEKGTIDRPMLTELVQNFSAYPGPVPIGFGPHPEDDFGDRAGASPGFVEALTLRGDTLYARLDLGVVAFATVVRDRAYRGFSIEARKNMRLPTKTFEGWVLTGGVFTNRPSLDVHFKIAAIAKAECSAEARTAVEFSMPKERGKEIDMSDQTINLATHEAKVNEMKAQFNAATQSAKAANDQADSLAETVATLSQEKSKLSIDLQAATTERDSLKAMTNQKDATIANLTKTRDGLLREKTEAKLKLQESNDKFVGLEVRRVIEEAGENGVAGAIFEGYEADPAAWMRSQWVSLEAFEKQIKSLYGVIKLSGSGPVKSGHDPKTANDSQDDQATKLTAEEQAVFDKLHLTPTFGNATTEEEARKLYLASKAKS